MKTLRFLGVGVLALGLALALVRPAYAANHWIVTTTDDVNDGVCEWHHCSLREAINAANANPTDADIIFVDFDHYNVIVFQPLSPLPPLTSNITIKTLTYENSIAFPENSRPPNVILDGSLAVLNTPWAAGLEINGDHSYVQGLSIQHWYDGIVLNGSFNEVDYNYIGTDGTTPQPNTHAGIVVYGPDNLIGGSSHVTFSDVCAAPCNVISGNGEFGIYIYADRTRVLGNLIGTNWTGSFSVPNGTGVQVFGTMNYIGLLSRGNVISGNLTAGVRMDLTAPDNLIAANRIGTDLTGMAAVPNGGFGIEDCGHATSIQSNWISGNRMGGIHVDGWCFALETRIQGNLIGSDALGAGTLPNQGPGIRVNLPDNTLIGTDGDGINDSAEGNLITGNLWEGIEIRDERLYVAFPAARIWGNTIRNNNNGVGILLWNAANILVGGSRVGMGNVIVGNGGGILIKTSGAGNVVKGNYVGVWPDGTQDGNTFYGMGIVDSSGNTIGGTNPGEGNVVAFNGGPGVAVAIEDSPFAENNLIPGNAIHDNGDVGIDLGWDGVTLNDPSDPDTGPNQLQNFPVLTSVTTDGTTISIAGSLNSTPSTIYRIEFFASGACDPAGNGEGEQYLGSAQVQTDAGGNAVINASLAPAGLVGSLITATATDLTRNETSEFSACRVVSAAIVSAMENANTLVDGLVQSGDLGQQQGKTLNTLVNVAIDQVEKGNLQAAAAQMNVFIGKVNRYVEKGLLDQKLAQPLVDGAQQVIDLIENP